MSNEQLMKQLEEKYNINLNRLDKNGEKTYWDLRKYFTKEIEEDYLLISTEYATMCCMRTDIKTMKEDFNKQLKEITDSDSGEICEDPLIEDVMGEKCQYCTRPRINKNNHLNVKKINKLK